MDSPELMASCFPFDLLHVVLGPTILEVTSGNDLFLPERCLLTELEDVVAENWLKIDGLLARELQ